jgi:DNA polymerase I-like protein with 3'-5' exonuclease and polymerase domains
MKTPFVILELADAIAKLDDSQLVFADLETCGLYGKPRMLQVYQPHLEHVMLVEWPNVFELMLALGKLNTVWHNSHYDITTMQQTSGTRWCPEQFEDTFYLARLTFPEKEKFSLDEVFTYCISHCPYTKQGLDKKKLQKSDWSKLVLTEEQLLYAATDVYHMPEVWECVSNQIHNPNYKLDMLTLRRCFDFQWNGMPVIKSKLNALYEANEAKVKALNVPINVNSWQQVRPYIGETESDGLALATFALQGNERAGIVREARTLIKLNSFLKKFDTDDGRTYGKFLPSARSGRLTSKDQNQQQLPRASKGVFGYEVEDGRVLIYADYAQLELRTLCAIVTCLMMETLFRKGTDLHGFTAEMLFGEAWTKAHRQLSKTYNFNLTYGGGIPMLQGILIKQANILIDERKLNKDRCRWRNLWKEIYSWQERGISAWRKGRLGSTPMGRQYKAKLMTDQLNIENQGAGAEVAKLALHYFGPALEEAKKLDAYLVNFIHDSYIVDCPNDPAIYQPIAMQMAESMQEAWFEMSKLFAIKDLPMPVDVAVGFNWGDIEDDDVPNLWDYSLDGMAMLEKVND